MSEFVDMLGQPLKEGDHVAKISVYSGSLYVDHKIIREFKGIRMYFEDDGYATTRVIKLPADFQPKS